MYLYNIKTVNTNWQLRLETDLGNVQILFDSFNQDAARRRERERERERE